MPLAFEELGRDVGLLILSLCDIKTVLDMGRVNIFFHKLSMRKQLWILLMEDLVMQLVVDLPCSRPLKDHSVEELVALVKRTVVGPATWCLLNNAPTLAEEISLPDVSIDVEEAETFSGANGYLERILP
ncbi:hypothetical protein K438DRAFT_1961493 [Mycena galopus ATCC 62051]|nr:hypothetical protein K438DRAFT_1961493 [Mycena galopus ATCC 62051]